MKNINEYWYIEDIFAKSEIQKNNPEHLIATGL